MKADYSHIQSRLFDTRKISTSVSPCSKSMYVSVRQSKQKVQQIGNQKYEQAMKHVKKFNQYQIQRKEKQIRQKQNNAPLDPECSFKPKLIKSKYSECRLKVLKNQISRTSINNSMILQNSAENGKLQKDKGTPYSKKNETGSTVLIKSDTARTILYCTKPQPIKNTNSRNINPQQRCYKTSQMLVSWGKQRDFKKINKKIELQVASKRSNNTVSPQSSSYSRSVQKKTCDPKYIRNYKNNNIMAGLSLNLSSISSSAGQQKCHSPSSIQKISKTVNVNAGGKNGPMTTPHRAYKYISNTVSPTGRSSFIFEENNKWLSTSTTGNNFSFARSVASQASQVNQPQGRLTQIGSQQGFYTRYQEKLLAKQTQRGQNKFYLRQARANVKKNYKGKTDLLVKDKTYTKKFSYLP